MLLKYLNQLEQAVEAARQQPGREAYDRCARCVAELEAYLDGQVEPVQRRGRELMAQLVPSSIHARMPGNRQPSTH